MQHQYKYPRPAVTVDIVVFGTDLDDLFDPLKVLLIRRGRGVWKDAWALPGGYVRTGDAKDPGESLDEAAQRELEEETHCQVTYLEQLYTFGDPARDPRGRTISVAYYALVRTADYEAHGGGDAADAFWAPIDQAKNLAFDHDEILSVALERLKAKVRYAPIGFNLLPYKFSLADLHRLYEAVLMRDIDKRNFYERARALGILKEAGVEKSGGKPGRCAKLYRFDKRAYDQAVKRGFNFEI